MTDNFLPLSQQLPSDPKLARKRQAPLIEKKSSDLEVLGAQFALDQTSGGTNALVRAAARGTLDDDFIATPEQLNKQYPDMSVPFDAPMSSQKAQAIFDQDRKRKQLEKVISLGDQDNALLEAGKFIVGIGAGLTDPVGMAIGMATGAGIMKVLGGSLLRGGVASKVLKTSISTAQKIEGVAAGASIESLATGAVSKSITARAFEGGVGNALENLLVTQPLLESEGVDSAHYNNLATAIAAGVLFPVGMGAASKTFNFLRHGKNADIKTEKAVLLSERQMENGQKINTEAYVNAERIQELPKLKEELEQAKLEGDESKISELEELVEDTENLEPQNRAEIAEEANSIKSDLDYKKDVEDDFTRGLAEPFEDLDTKFQQDFEELDTRLTEIGEDDFFDEATMREIESAQAEVANIDQLDQMARMASFCVRG